MRERGSLLDREAASIIMHSKMGASKRGSPAFSLPSPSPPHLVLLTAQVNSTLGIMENAHSVSGTASPQSTVRREGKQARIQLRVFC